MCFTEISLLSQLEFGVIQMLQYGELYKQWPLSLRYAACVCIFLAAFLLRFLILPVDAGLAFLTLYPAVVISFYICGTMPTVLVVVVSGFIADYIFTPPFWTPPQKLSDLIPVTAFLFSATLIGLVVKRLQNNTEKLHEHSLALQINEERYKQVVEDQSEIICRFKVDGTILYVNDAYCHFFGQPRENLIGGKWQPVVVHEDIALINEKLSTLTPLKPIVTIENRVFAGDGSIRWGQFVNHAFFDAAGNIIEMQAVGRDITALKTAQENLQQISNEQQAMLDNDLVGIMKIKNRQIVWKNRAISRIFGYEHGELIGQSTRIFYTDDQAYQALGNQAYPRLQQQKTYRTQIELMHKNGEKVWVDLSGVLLSTDYSESLWMLADITALKKQEALITQMAYHDTLTGLPNRLLVSDRLIQAMAQVERSNRMLAVCYLDLDGFKPVNDNYGHEVGDLLLKEIASRMQASVRTNDTVGRLGGDEFVLLLTDLESAEEYQTVVERLMSAINQPFSLSESIQVQVGASIGIAIFPTDSDDPEILLRYADHAMYKAKQAGRNRVHLFAGDM